MSDADIPASPTGTDGTGGPHGGVRYREKLSASPGVWAVLTLMAFLFGLVSLRTGPTAGAATFAVTWLIMAGLLIRLTPVVEVGPELFVAGGARIPLHLLGAAESLDAGQMRVAGGPELDARAYLLLRGWIGSGVRVHLDDPEDPTPYWLISSRRPDQLVAALEQARRTA